MVPLKRDIVVKPYVCIQHWACISVAWFNSWGLTSKSYFFILSIHHTLTIVYFFFMYIWCVCCILFVVWVPLEWKSQLNCVYILKNGPIAHTYYKIKIIYIYVSKLFSIIYFNIHILGYEWLIIHYRFYWLWTKTMGHQQSKSNTDIERVIEC